MTLLLAIIALIFLVWTVSLAMLSSTPGTVLFTLLSAWLSLPTSGGLPALKVVVTFTWGRWRRWDVLNFTYLIILIRGRAEVKSLRVFVSCFRWLTRSPMPCHATCHSMLCRTHNALRACKVPYVDRDHLAFPLTSCIKFESLSLSLSLSLTLSFSRLAIGDSFGQKYVFARSTMSLNDTSDTFASETNVHMRRFVDAPMA